MPGQVPSPDTIRRRARQLQQLSTDALLEEIARVAPIRVYERPRYGRRAIPKKGVVGGKRQEGLNSLRFYYSDFVDLLCKRLDYCRTKDRYGDVITLIVALVPLAVQQLGIAWATAVAIAVAFMRFFGSRLDDLCKCGKGLSALKLPPGKPVSSKSRQRTPRG